MTLQDIFDSLKYGELAQVFHTDPNDPSCESPDSRRRFWNSIKLGLTDMHNRLLLRELRVTLMPADGVSTYNLTKAYAASNNASAIPVEDRYLDDSKQPFTGDFIKLERIYDQDRKEYAINTLGSKVDLRTPTMTELEIPDDFEWDALTLVYRADHPVVDEDLVVSMPEQIQINLPSSHIQALLYYTASRVLNPIGMTHEFHEGNEYYKKYMMEINFLTGKGLGTGPQGVADEKFVSRGWV